MLGASGLCRMGAPIRVNRCEQCGVKTYEEEFYGCDCVEEPKEEQYQIKEASDG